MGRGLTLPPMRGEWVQDAWRKHGLGTGRHPCAAVAKTQSVATEMGRRVGFGVTPTLLLPKKKYTFGAGRALPVSLLDRDWGYLA